MPKQDYAGRALNEQTGRARRSERERDDLARFEGEGGSTSAASPKRAAGNGDDSRTPRSGGKRREQEGEDYGRFESEGGAAEKRGHNGRLGCGDEKQPIRSRGGIRKPAER